jgi:hypothetical protein
MSLDRKDIRRPEPTRLNRPGAGIDAVPIFFWRDHVPQEGRVFPHVDALHGYPSHPFDQTIPTNYFHTFTYYLDLATPILPPLSSSIVITKNRTEKRREDRP